MGLLSSLGRPFGLSSPKGIKNPAEAAMPYLNQIPGVGQKYHDPFIQSGQQAQGITQPIYQNLAQNPQAFLDALMRGYSPSEGYKYKENVLGRAMQNTAAQGGYAGTPYSQMEQGSLIRGLLGEDQQQYLQNVLGLQGQGLSGLEGMIGRGYQSSGGLADYIGNVLGSQAGLAFQGQAGLNQQKYDQNANKSRFWGDIAKSIGAAMGGGGGGGMSGGGTQYNQYSMPAGGIGGGNSFRWQNPNSWMGNY